ncbi:MAG: hypothetical protein AAF737_04700 [Pseudomonadota bacterium]
MPKALHIDAPLGKAAVYDRGLTPPGRYDEPLTAPLSWLGDIDFHSDLNYAKVLETRFGLTASLPQWGPYVRAFTPQYGGPSNGVIGQFNTDRPSGHLLRQYVLGTHGFGRPHAIRSVVRNYKGRDWPVQGDLVLDLFNGSVNRRISVVMTDTQFVATEIIAAGMGEEFGDYGGINTNHAIIDITFSAVTLTIDVVVLDIDLPSSSETCAQWIANTGQPNGVLPSGPQAVAIDAANGAFVVGDRFDSRNSYFGSTPFQFSMPFQKAPNWQYTPANGSFPGSMRYVQGATVITYDKQTSGPYGEPSSPQPWISVQRDLTPGVEVSVGY